MSIIKYIFYFILFFILFYLENYNITDNLSFSQAWKIPLVLFMIWYVFRRRIVYRLNFNKVAYFYGLKNIFNQGIFINPVTNIVETFRFANFPLLYDTFNIYFKDPEKLGKFIVRISQYFILSSIPFLLGTLKSVKEGIQFGESLSFIGIFQNPHGASTVFSLALLVLIYQLKTDRLSLGMRIYNILLILLGSYCLYLSFVRTGYLMFVIGIIVLFFPNKISLKQFIFFCILTITLGATFYRLLEMNDSFRQRIFDQREGKQMDAGSGRLVFAVSSLKYWSEGNLQQLILGRGLEDVKDNLEKRTGLRVFSHNGFVDAIAINGVIGISLLLLFIYFTFKNIRRNKRAKTYRLSLAIFLCYVSFQLTQGGVLFPIDLYIASILNLTNKEQLASIN